MKRISILLAAMCTALVLCAGAVAAAKAQAADGQSTAYVDVGVATSWVFPGFDQTVDQPAVSNPSDVSLWLENMSLGQEQRLIGDLETQALYGQRVVILEDQGEWLKVAVEGQPRPRNALGYPGWVPRRQLTFDTDLGAYEGKPFAQVRTKSTNLYNDRGLSIPFIELSYATRLPVVGRSADAIEVATPDDGNKWIRASDATVYGSEAAIPKPTGEDLVRTAKMFHAPSPGSAVSIVDIVGSGWIKEYAGAIRYT